MANKHNKQTFKIKENLINNLVKKFNSYMEKVDENSKVLSLFSEYDDRLREDFTYLV